MDLFGSECFETYFWMVFVDACTDTSPFRLWKWCVFLSVLLLIYVVLVYFRAMSGANHIFRNSLLCVDLDYFENKNGNPSTERWSGKKRAVSIAKKKLPIAAIYRPLFFWYPRRIITWYIWISILYLNCVNNWNVSNKTTRNRSRMILNESLSELMVFLLVLLLMQCY